MLGVGWTVKLEAGWAVARQALSTRHGLDPAPLLVQDLTCFHPVGKTWPLIACDFKNQLPRLVWIHVPLWLMYMYIEGSSVHVPCVM